MTNKELTDIENDLKSKIKKGKQINIENQEQTDQYLFKKNKSYRKFSIALIIFIIFAIISKAYVPLVIFSIIFARNFIINFISNCKAIFCLKSANILNNDTVEVIEETIDGIELLKEYKKGHDFSKSELLSILNSLSSIIPEEDLEPVVNDLNSITKKEISEKFKISPKDYFINLVEQLDSIVNYLKENSDNKELNRIAHLEDIINKYKNIIVTDSLDDRVYLYNIPNLEIIVKHYQKEFCINEDFSKTLKNN
jgi:hypothetical protein